jgi:hypothetical protein
MASIFDMNNIALDEKFWNEKDQAATDTWAESKRKSWDEGGKMKDKYPEKEALEAWITKQSKKTKDAALTVRSQPQVYFDIELGEGDSAEKIGRIIMRLRLVSCLSTKFVILSFSK